MAKRPRYTDLRTYRLDNNLTQAEAGDSVGISQEGWSRIERCQRRPGPLVALRMHKVTGIPLAIILKLKDPPLDAPPRLTRRIDSRHDTVHIADDKEPTE